MLVIDGTPRKGLTYSLRFTVFYEGNEILLIQSMFNIFARLADARRNGDGWVCSTDLCTGYANGPRYMWRLRKCLGETGPEIASRMIRRNEPWLYRLEVDAKDIFFNHRQLRDHPDAEIRHLVGGNGDLSDEN